MGMFTAMMGPRPSGDVYSQDGSQKQWGSLEPGFVPDTMGMFTARIGPRRNGDVYSQDGSQTQWGCLEPG